MPDGGYNALMAAVRKGESGAPRLLSFDEPLSTSLTGAAFGIEYEDAGGRRSRRWVTVRGIDRARGAMTAYCWERRALRTFRLDRIQEVIDGAGEVHSGETFFLMRGYAIPEPRPAKGRGRGSRASQEEISDTGAMLGGCFMLLVIVTVVGAIIWAIF